MIRALRAYLRPVPLSVVLPPWQAALDLSDGGSPLTAYAAGLRSPHCDELVLHAPGQCQFCDGVPEIQRNRIVAGVRFTGQPDLGDGTVSCPSEDYRPAELIERWPGNRAYPSGSKVEPY